MNKNKIYKNIIIFLALFVMIAPAISLLAVEANYTVLAPLPGTTVDGSKTNIGTYVNGMFKFLVGLSGAIAVIQIVVGGFQYMSSDAMQGKSEGRQRIESAIKGLLIVIGSWVVLNTINPGIFNFTLEISKATVNTKQGFGTSALYNPQTAADIQENCPTCTLTKTLPISTQSRNGAVLSCNNCVPIDSKIGDNGNTYRNIAPNVNDKLIALNNSFGEGKWQVTEAYPPTVTHSNSCHYEGSCIDARPVDMSQKSILDFSNQATKAGFKPIFEAGSQDILKNYPCDKMTCQVVPGVKPHFSLYTK